MTGVNQRNRKSASGNASRMTNAVTDALVSRASAAIQLSGGIASSMTTAAGLPVNGASLNASTVLSRRSAIERT